MSQSSLADALANYPAEVPTAPADVAGGLRGTRTMVVVFDDDPTGTQSVAGIPVLTRWQSEDFRAVFADAVAPARTDPSADLAWHAVYVLHNTRSVEGNEAARRNEEAARNALNAAAEAGLSLVFVSRSDSTLRGHFPLETDVLGRVLEESGAAVDAVIMVPAFPDAGRVTVGSEHFMVGADGDLTRVSETEFAADASFGFTTSFLPGYVEEKTEGRVSAAQVVPLTLATIRAGAGAVAEALGGVSGGAYVVADTASEADLLTLSLGIAEAEAKGKQFLYRVGPPFMRARLGQEKKEPLTPAEIFGTGEAAQAALAERAPGGLIAVGSHVGMTTRQLTHLLTNGPGATEVELDVARLLDPEQREACIAEATDAVCRAIAEHDAIIYTSRTLVRSEDRDESLRISRLVSSGLTDVVNAVLTRVPPRFVVAKGGITSSDVATEGLEIRRALARGPMLPGIISLWEATDGPATGIPYVVFPGNVGTDESLTDVVLTLHA